MALAQYSELFWFPSGDLATSVTARVFLHSTNTLATLYADAAGTVPLANPASTSGTGRLEFWVEEGRYWVHIDSEAFDIAVGAAAQPATQQDILDEETRADAAYAQLLHAARHAAAGDDPVTLTQAQVTGLAAALAALLPLAGGTMTGTINSTLGTAGATARASLVGGDAFDRFRQYADGRLEWGPGNAARDTVLYRDAANVLRTDDGLTVALALRHLGTSLGFYGATATTKPTVSGSRGGNAALASLLTALAGLGLVTDSTTA